MKTRELHDKAEQDSDEESLFVERSREKEIGKMNFGPTLIVVMLNQREAYHRCTDWFELLESILGSSSRPQYDVSTVRKIDGV